MSSVFIALQTTEETRPIIEAIIADNPEVIVNEQPAMVKINREGSIVINRTSIENILERDFDLQELHLHIISLSGKVDETEDSFTISWNL